MSRSGGKLVRTLLDGHPQLRVLPFEHWQTPRKVKFNAASVAHFSRMDATAKLDCCGAAHAQTAMRKLHGNAFVNAVMTLWQSDAVGAETPAQLFQSLGARYFDALGSADRSKPIVNHCGSLCLLTPTQLDSLFGIASHILTIRDPRAVWVSKKALSANKHHRTIQRVNAGDTSQRSSARYVKMTRRRDGAPNYLQQFCNNYRFMVTTHYRRPEALVLRFEDLIQAPETNLRGIAGRLGLTWDPCLLEPTQLCKPRMANTSFTREAGIDPSAARDWRSRIDPGDRAFIEAQLADELRKLEL